jgi:hypothetical protein
MSRTLGALLIVASLGCIPSAKAAGTNVKCAMNEDRVWVYESVVDFNLAAKLKCGEPVQIIGRIKGYVKVQTQAGVEGYVADSALPKSALPPEPEEKPNDVQSASVAALAHHAPPPTIDSKEPRASTTVASMTPAKSNVSSPTPSISSNAVPVPTATAYVSAPPVATRPQPPSVAPATPPVVKPEPLVVASTAPAPAPKPTPVVASPAPVSQPAEVEITLSTAPTPAAAAPSRAPVSAPATAAPAPIAPAPIAPAPVATNSQPASAPPAAAYASNVASAPTRDRAPAAPEATIQPVSDAAPRAAANPDEDEDTAVKALENENAGCTHFFSAYGLSPNQYKWLAQNRKKAFPSVCPAPSPSMVDFVVIFTHDVAFYNVTMPAAVHVDSNGFSDWTPMSTVDTALMTQSEANSSHHEYVWVFHTNRGAFDPAKFSSRRKPLFSKGETNMLGSHGGYKTVMDALTYIESNSTATR